MLLNEFAVWSLILPRRISLSIWAKTAAMRQQLLSPKVGWFPQGSL